MPGGDLIACVDEMIADDLHGQVVPFPRGHVDPRVRDQGDRVNGRLRMRVAQAPSIVYWRLRALECPLHGQKTGVPERLLGHPKDTSAFQLVMGAAPARVRCSQDAMREQFLDVAQCRIRTGRLDPACRLRQEGTVGAFCTIDRNERLLSHRIVGGSGYPLLDQDVQAMLERANPMPAFPPGMSQCQLTVAVPINFHLR